MTRHVFGVTRYSSRRVLCAVNAIATAAGYAASRRSKWDHAPPKTRYEVLQEALARAASNMHPARLHIVRELLGAGSLAPVEPGLFSTQLSAATSGGGATPGKALGFGGKDTESPVAPASCELPVGDTLGAAPLVLPGALPPTNAAHSVVAGFRKLTKLTARIGKGDAHDSSRVPVEPGWWDIVKVLFPSPVKDAANTVAPASAGAGSSSGTGPSGEALSKVQIAHLTRQRRAAIACWLAFGGPGLLWTISAESSSAPRAKTRKVGMQLRGRPRRAGASGREANRTGVYVLLASPGHWVFARLQKGRRGGLDGELPLPQLPRRVVGT